MATILRETWSSYSSFRRAIDRLVSDSARLATILPEDLDDPAELEVKLGGDETAIAHVSALLLLQNDAQQVSVDETLSDLRSLHAEEYGPSEDIDLALREISRIIQVDPETVKRRQIERLQRSALPTYIFSRGFVDGRVVPFANGDIEVTPVGLLRVTLDEPVGASDTITFQLTRDGIEDLKEEIDRIEQLTERLLSRLAPGDADVDR